MAKRTTKGPLTSRQWPLCCSFMDELPSILRFVLFFLGFLVKGHKVNRLHQKGNISTVGLHLADNLPCEGEQQSRAVNSEQHLNMFGGNAPHHEDGRMLNLQDEQNLALIL